MFFKWKGKGHFPTRAKSRDREIVRAQKKVSEGRLNIRTKSCLQNHVVWSRTLKSSVKSYATGLSTKCYFNGFLFMRVFIASKSWLCRFKSQKWRSHILSQLGQHLIWRRNHSMSREVRKMACWLCTEMISGEDITLLSARLLHRGGSNVYVWQISFDVQLQIQSHGEVTPLSSWTPRAAKKI